MKRRVFYSFHYEADNWRAAQVINMGAIEDDQPTTPSHWEEVRKSGDLAIKKWISREIAGRSCTVVLVGENTAGRKWINYEICKSWNEGMGVVGIRIHGLKDSDENLSKKGKTLSISHSATPRKNCLPSCSVITRGDPTAKNDMT